MTQIDADNTSSQLVSLSPSPASLVESLRSIGYTVETALADIIDNSISAGAIRISVRFLWNGGQPWVAVLDNGCGMSPDQLRGAMRFGCQSPLVGREKSDLGRFGLGLKTASISQCRRLTVSSKMDHVISACEWDLNHLVRSGTNDWLLKVLDDKALSRDPLLNPLIQEFLGDLKSGTIVLWREMDTMLAGTEQVDSERKFSELLGQARVHLETVFHRFLSPDSGQRAIHIDFNNSPLVALNPFGPAIAARRELTMETITVGDESIEVQPYVLPHQNKLSRSEYEKYAGEGGYLQNQGFYVYRNRRLIVKATWFRLIKKDELNKLIRVRIDIPNSLDHIWGINVNKSQVAPPEIVRKKLKSVIQRISREGREVYRRRAAVLIDRNKVPVWKREVREGKVCYSVNREHPLLSVLLEQADTALRGQIERAFHIISQAFPIDVFYADKANDDIEISLGGTDEVMVRNLCREMVESFRAIGNTDNEIERKLVAMEIPGVNESMIQEALTL